MNIHELEGLLTDLESDRIERKASASNSKRIHQAICAFANDLPHHQQPGVIFIGVHDNGNCAYLAITDQLLLILSQMREHVLPFPTMKIQKHVLNGCEIAVIIVEPADAPPVRYEGRVWVRVGPRRAVATREEERRLSEKRRAKDMPFDLQPVFSATLEDLDLDAFRRTYLPSTLHHDILDENDRAIEHQLSSTRFIATNKQSTPTILGILVVGTDYRNAYLAESMKNLGYVQRFGLGIPLTYKSLQDNGNPLPEFTAEDAHIQVIVRRRP